MIDKVVQIGLTFLCHFYMLGFCWKMGEYGELVPKWHGKVRPVCAKIVGEGVEKGFFKVGGGERPI